MTLANLLISVLVSLGFYLAHQAWIVEREARNTQTVLANKYKEVILHCVNGDRFFLFIDDQTYFWTQCKRSENQQLRLRKEKR